MQFLKFRVEASNLEIRSVGNWLQSKCSPSMFRKNRIISYPGDEEAGRASCSRVPSVCAWCRSWAGRDRCGRGYAAGMQRRRRSRSPWSGCGARWGWGGTGPGRRSNGCAPRPPGRHRPANHHSPSPSVQMLNVVVVVLVFTAWIIHYEYLRMKTNSPVYSCAIFFNKTYSNSFSVDCN